MDPQHCIITVSGLFAEVVFMLINVICSESAAWLGREADSLLALQASRSQHLL
jgi:hypothetical protein